MIMRIDKILCPTDLSANSASGIAYAQGLSQEYRAALVVLHVTSFPPVPIAALCELDALPGQNRVLVPPSVDELLRRASVRLDAFVKSIPIVDCQTRVAFGKPAMEIIVSAIQERADLIVMAKRHLGFIRRLLSPSVSEQVSRKAPCPVLSICPPKLQRPTGAKARPGVTGLLAGVEA
jgi:nucleotide-binding universal stress UspA family protein